MDEGSCDSVSPNLKLQVQHYCDILEKLPDFLASCRSGMK